LLGLLELVQSSLGNSVEVPAAAFGNVNGAELARLDPAYDLLAANL